MKTIARFRTITAMAVLIFSFTVTAQNKQVSKGNNKIDPLPKDLEIQLALSSLPPHLRDSATVYTLNPDKGFELARKGTNGFHAFVARTGDDAMKGSWPLKEYRDDILYPVSFDQAGATSIMLVFFDIAEMQAKGFPSQELKLLIQDRYKANYYKSPERAGVSYMLSPIHCTYLDADNSDSVAVTSAPHIMHYAPYVTNKDIGGGAHGGMYPFLILPGAHGFTIQRIGETESNALRKEYAAMIERVCKIKKKWCLPADHTPMQHHH